MKMHAGWWLVIIDAGRDDEYVLGQHRTESAAQKEARQLQRQGQDATVIAVDDYEGETR